jgi:hypothetical protein
MRKRSKYKPKPKLVNPLGYVMESAKPLVEHETYVVDWQLKNNSAFEKLLKGLADKKDINTLVAARNITEGLMVTLNGPDVDGTLARSAVALIDLCDRGNAGKSLVMKAEELQAMRDMMQLHDELLSVVTVRQFERALEYTRNEIKVGRASYLKELKQTTGD